MRGSIAENDFASLSSAEWSLSGHQERLRGTLYGASPEFGRSFSATLSVISSSRLGSYASIAARSIEP